MTDPQARRRTVGPKKSSGAMRERVTLAIVGNGGAAAEAVLALRERGYPGDLHMFADNQHAPYNPMLGPYIVSGSIPVERAFPFGDEKTFYDANRVRAHLGEAVTHLDSEAQVLVTAQGREYQYDKCLVATGACPALPPIPGLQEALGETVDGPSPERRVFTIQNLTGVLALKQAVHALLARYAARSSAATKTGPRAAVLGASFAGVKIAQVLHELGFRVTLVEREPHLLPLAALPECAGLLEQHLLREGYHLRMGAAVSRLSLGTVTAEGLPGVRLEFGETAGVGGPDPHLAVDASLGPGAASLPLEGGAPACAGSAAEEVVDLVVLCTGTRPALSFLVPGQVMTGTGILVDEEMRSSQSTLYAAGDVAQGRNLLTGRHEIIGLWASARYQGRTAGRNLAGSTVSYPGNVPHNITHVGRFLFAAIGCVNERDEVDVTEEDGSYRFRVWKDGRLVGVNLLGRCLSAGVVRQALLRAALSSQRNGEATWINFRE